MGVSLNQIALVVADYDDAIQYYTNVLDFELLEDTVLSETKRWVTVSPKGENSCRLLLAKASNEEQLKAIGNQTGGRVFLFLYTDNFEVQYEKLMKHQVKITRGPIEEPYGKVLVFEDVYGNLWDLIEPIERN
ncbi:VOC family protein [uncultured Arcticibacterium sp.]|uniref:VOC family protein n=1 Tax=uncultured Arcticibacterium sp. TaxID=2173042 RepID=UPI0030FB73E5